MINKKPLPIGLSSLPKIINDGFLYIDKTESIYGMLVSSHYNFLARPRRFGKTLLISTLKEIFRGNRELFKNCWIATQSEYAWTAHPIIHIDFNIIDKKSPHELEVSLSRRLDDIAEEYGVSLADRGTPAEKLIRLVQLISKHGRVVILIDEYDQAITSNLHNLEIAEGNRLILRSFYEPIKSLDEHVRFFFMTGVSKFTKTSLFSGLNNLNDISFDVSAAQIVGYTESEVITYLMPYVDDVAQSNHRSREVVLQEMKEWYNGYRFSRSEISVYNPFSVFFYLVKKECSNYWFESATPTFLVELLKRGVYSYEDLVEPTASVSELNKFDVNDIGLLPLLYQTGYLTLESYSERTLRYRLCYPNKEVEVSLGGHLLGVFLDKKSEAVNRYVEDMRQSLKMLDIKEFVEYLQILFAGIPYALHIPKESYYHSILHIIGTLLGFDTSCEVMTSVGRIDMVIDMPHAVFIFELKLASYATAQDALDQIIFKRYSEKYQKTSKRIVLVGLSFDFSQKKIHTVSVL